MYLLRENAHLLAFHLRVLTYLFFCFFQSLKLKLVWKRAAVACCQLWVSFSSYVLFSIAAPRLHALVELNGPTRLAYVFQEHLTYFLCPENLVVNLGNSDTLNALHFFCCWLCFACLMVWVGRQHPFCGIYASVHPGTNWVCRWKRLLAKGIQTLCAWICCHSPQKIKHTGSCCVENQWWLTKRCQWR